MTFTQKILAKFHNATLVTAINLLSLETADADGKKLFELLRNLKEIEPMVVNGNLRNDQIEETAKLLLTAVDWMTSVEIFPRKGAN